MNYDTDNITEQSSMSVEELRYKLCTSYALFCLYMQDDGYFDPVHRELCEWTQYHIENWEREVEEKGTCLGELAYIMPRGSLKSTIVTKYLPVWLTVRRYYLFNDQSTRSLIAGNTFDNAKQKMMGDIGGLFENHNTFKVVFAELLPRKGRDGSRWSAKGLEINRDGSYPEETFQCAGTNTKLIGRHYNIIVEDDTTAPDISDYEDGMTMPSQETIEQAIGFHQAATSLFVPKSFRLSVVVSTRWASEDLIHKVLTEENYKYFNKPAVNDLGEYNFSVFYDEESLAKIKNRIGSFMYSMLYLNKPLDDNERVFNPDNFDFVVPDEVPVRGFKTITVDPAISEKEDSCESSITVAQHVSHGYMKHQYWWEDINCKLLPFQLANRILDLAVKHHTDEVPVKYIVIETIAYQKALKYVLLNEMERRGISFKIGEFASRQQKEIRIQAMQPLFERKRIHFVRGKAIKEGVLDGALSAQTESQLTQFPFGKLVDTIDSWSMHYKFFKRDNKKDQGYVKESQDAAVADDPLAQAVLEIERKRKSANVATLASPDISWNGGLRPSTYGGLNHEFR
jgi:hypothetical protein